MLDVAQLIETEDKPDLSNQLESVLKKELKSLEKQIETLLDRVVDATNIRIIQSYQKRLAKLEQDKFVIDEKLQKTGKPVRDFDEMFVLALKFLSNPWNL